MHTGRRAFLYLLRPIHHWEFYLIPALLLERARLRFTLRRVGGFPCSGEQLSFLLFGGTCLTIGVL